MSATSETRRHDLDALRGLAMLLGVVLHAAMAFVPGLWPVQDSAATPAMGVLVLLIHGFRMPLFFLVSGFFTALLWRRYGLKGVVRHRLLRIFIPCLLGTLTIVPLYRMVVRASAKAPETAGRAVVDRGEWKSVTDAQRRLAAGADPNQPDARFGATPLSWAALRGDTAQVRLLIARGAIVQQRNADGSTALHCAALMGSDSVVRLLLKQGADVTARSKRGDTPGELTFIDATVTQQLIGELGLPPHPQHTIDAGRERCRRLLPPATPRPAPWLDTLRQRYGTLLRQPCFATPVFEHLWFLWFLVWLLPFFALWTRLADRMRASPRWVISPLRYGWLIPLTVAPQLFMGTQMPAFGPDTATGLVPPPHLLFYYSLFFFFGAVYFEAGDTQGVLGRRWWLTLAIALCLLLPLGVVTLGLPPQLTASIHVSYSWFMVFGCLGLARRFLAKESRVLRYLSDSSYWLYIAHLPLIVALQIILQDLNLPLGVKLLVLLAVSMGVLLLSYRFLVRHTWVGGLLNGKREA